MSGRNLKIRITVGHDGKSLGSTNDTTKSNAPTLQRSKPSVTQILTAGITSLVVIGSAWISLSDREEPLAEPPPIAANETTTQPNEPVAVAPPHLPAGAIGAPEPTAPIVATAQEHEQAPANTKTNAIADKKAEKIVKATTQPGRITRAALTTAIVNREPVDKLNKSVTAREKSKPLFYFTEIVDMKGTTLTHRWRHEGRVVADMKFRIESDRYRVFSNKQMRANSKGNWQIEVLDQTGRTLQTAHFTYQ